MKNLELAVDLKAQLDALRPLDADQEKRIWQKFRFDWNYHSNNIEGNSLTFGETKSLLLHNITAQGKSLKDHIEITGHNEAIDVLVDLTRGDAPLTESFVRQLHELILRERCQVDAITPEGAPTRRWIEVGQYKTGQNHVQTVTGEIFRFAEPIDVPGKMHTLLQTINELQAPSSAEVVFVAAKAHYDFVLIHPFDDGNGRIARLLMNLILIKYGFPPAIIKTQDKQQYFSALRQADGGQLDVFVEYIAGCVCASLQIMLAGARGESVEEPDEQDRKIKMLARMIEGKAGKLSATRTVEALDTLFEHSFVPLARRLSEAAKKFEPMYSNVEKHSYVDSEDISGSAFEIELADIQKRITERTTFFMMHVQFNNLAFQGMDQVSNEWQVAIQTGPASHLLFSGNVASDINRSYDQQLSTEEIDGIVRLLVDDHIHKIEKVTGISLSTV